MPLQSLIAAPAFSSRDRTRRLERLSCRDVFLFSIYQKCPRHPNSLTSTSSSRFGPGKQYGNFGAVGAAWIFSKESFLSKSKLLSYGKIRSSYGVTGNDLIDNYQYLSTYGITGTNYQDIVTLAPFRIANTNFGGENNKKFETAVEIGLSKDRIF